MKIQKAIFSVSEPPAYSSYWNMQSQLYKEGLGIEPICLLFGKKANTDMSEEFGKVIEMETIVNLPWLVQMTWSKFDFTRTEPETTWIVGDIDLLPLNRSHFVDNISGVPDDYYLNLNSEAIALSRTGRSDGFLTIGSERHGKDGGFTGCDLPAHYHVAKGKFFEQLYFPGRSFYETVNHLVTSRRYGFGAIHYNWPEEKRKNDPYNWYWCAEENYTSELLWNAIKSGRIKYKGFGYCNQSERINSTWNTDRMDYDYNPLRVSDKKIVDIHCHAVRPYYRQAAALEKIIKLSGLLV